MIFGGFQKTSLIDYPGKISCIIFLSGCNLTCPYCHNPGLARGDQPPPPFLNKNWILDFLKERTGFLEGVVITGGEPTLNREIFSLCGDIKSLGYKVKLDTNGTRPEVVRNLAREKLIDFIAMDIKTSPPAYSPVLSKEPISEQIFSSIRIVMDSGLPYEFRTTCVRPIIDENVIKEVAEQIRGAGSYVLQRFQSRKILNPSFFKNKECAFTENELEKLKAAASPYVRKCIVR
ncbi:MAG: anaerobic ribonucleoside-triphosphate reductase activating protein [Deltaproteobacteria bacterium]|nr:anaerobic ribonucleoside-triphosphate reductase activating protein [Deltaproteobacteria bacterium]